MKFRLHIASHALRLILACCGIALAADGVCAAASRPNIIFILTDDQRRDTLGVYGNVIVQTPHLDQLAADGVVFDQATINSAICTPSRVTMFLGQYERRHGVNFNSGTAVAPSAWEKSYPVLLRAAGYFTGYIGKNHTPVGERGYESGIIERSFDFWYAAHRHLTFYPKDRHPIFGRAKADTQVEILAEGVTSFLSPRTDFIAGASSFLGQRPSDKPFALTIAFNVPHGQGTGTMALRPSDPELYRETYRERLAEFPLPLRFLARAERTTPRLPADVLRDEYRQTEYDYVNRPDTLRERMVRQYQTVTGVDRFVGQLRRQLAEAGLAENTVIIYTSDHGLLLGEFSLGGKALNYDVCLRVPLIVMDPRQPASGRGRRSDALAEAVDLAPTLLDLGGAAVPASMQGRSLLPIIAGRNDALRPYAFSENLWSNYFGNPRCESVRSAEWKYIRYFVNDHALFRATGKSNSAPVTPEHILLYRSWLSASIRGEPPVHEELFDLSSDPDEAVNLALAPRHAQRLAELRAECDRQVRAARGADDQDPATVQLVAGKLLSP